MDWLLILLLILGLITLIGHGFWVLLAWIFRGGRRRLGPRAAAPLPVDPFAELTITARQVQRLLAVGSISVQTCQEILIAIDARMPARPPSLTPPRPVLAT